ncbi:hypothetical protein Aasi_0987 [Candidatus Amoebophilus asiaticus 5a2]|uniref:Uncharacterized protein n=1 Tax=Amoebophilus asiaticus (strain 5a2) TaxID=452471 RepID=B3ESZ0_AMOA5|nr:hypothetical protein [Candidatus Amoebophilus asiaticus]ACE06342.1 hypothetical protein Aasi_0987 [Candidatus Amoebophilus asiaticus 5a2]
MRTKFYISRLSTPILLFILLLIESCKIPPHIIQPNTNTDPQVVQTSDSAKASVESTTIEENNISDMVGSSEGIYLIEGPETIPVPPGFDKSSHNSTAALDFYSSNLGVTYLSQLKNPNIISLLPDIVNTDFVIARCNNKNFIPSTPSVSSSLSNNLYQSRDHKLTTRIIPSITSHTSEQWKDLYLNLFTIKKSEDTYSIRLYTDGQFESLLKAIGLSPKEITQIKQLPKLDFTPISLLDLNNSENLFCVNEGEAGILDNPTAKHIFLTNELWTCIGVAVITPQKTLFAHLSEMSGYVDVSLSSLFTDNITIEERAQAKVVLVASCYTEGFAKLYRTLTTLGFKNFAIDIQPVIDCKKFGERWGHLHCQASALDHHLLAIGQPSLLKKRNKEELKLIETYLQENHFIKLVRSMIINAKTGEVYRLDIPLVKNDIKNDIELEAIYTLIKTKNLGSKFKENRFDAPSIE